MDIPKEIQCPLCQKLLRKACLMPCCQACACRGCIFQHLKASKHCWTCTEVVSMEMLTPSDSHREKVKTFTTVQQEPKTDVKPDIFIIEEFPKKSPSLTPTISEAVSETEITKNSKRNKSVVCLHCQNYGHETLYCPDMVCKECGVKGHGRISCPQLKKSYLRGKAVQPSFTKNTKNVQNPQKNPNDVSPQKHLKEHSPNNTLKENKYIDVNVPLKSDGNTAGNILQNSRIPIQTVPDTLRDANVNCVPELSTKNALPTKNKNSSAVSSIQTVPSTLNLLDVNFNDENQKQSLSAAVKRKIIDKIDSVDAEVSGQNSSPIVKEENVQQCTSSLSNITPELSGIAPIKISGGQRNEFSQIKDISISAMLEQKYRIMMQQQAQNLDMTAAIRTDSFTLGESLNTEPRDVVGDESKNNNPDNRIWNDIEPPPPPDISVTQYIKTERLEPIRNLVTSSEEPLSMNDTLNRNSTAESPSLSQNSENREKETRQNCQEKNKTESTQSLEQFIGNIKWFDNTQSQGVIEYMDKETTKFCHVTSDMVKEEVGSNDTVVFHIVDDPKFGKTAKNVYIPAKRKQEEKHNESKDNDGGNILKCNQIMEISSDEEFDENDAIYQILNNKKLKRKLLNALLKSKKKNTETNTVTNSSNTLKVSKNEKDIADDDSEKDSENDSDEEIVLLDCTCTNEPLNFCERCPAYFLESFEEVTTIKFDETEVILARILEYDQRGKRVAKLDLNYVRQIPLIHPQKRYKSKRFQLIEKLGENSLISCIRPIMCNSYAFVSVKNTIENKSTVNIHKGDFLGVCQNLNGKFIKGLIGTKAYRNVLNDPLTYESKIYSASNWIIQPNQQTLIKAVLMDPMPKDKNMFVNFKWPAVGLRIESGLRCLQFNPLNNENYVNIKIRNVTKKTYIVRTSQQIGMIQNVMNNWYCKKAIEKNNTEKDNKTKNDKRIKLNIRSKSYEKDSKNKRNNQGEESNPKQNVNTKQRPKSADVSARKHEEKSNTRITTSLPKIGIETQSRKRSFSNEDVQEKKTKHSKSLSRDSSIDDTHYDIERGRTFATGSVENIEEMLTNVETKINEHCDIAKLNPKDIRLNPQLKKDQKIISNITRSDINHTNAVLHTDVENVEEVPKQNECTNQQVLDLISIENVYISEDIRNISIMCEIPKIKFDGSSNMFSIKVTNIDIENIEFEKEILPILDNVYVMLTLSCDLKRSKKIAKGEKVGRCKVVEDFDPEERLTMSHSYELRTISECSIGSYKSSEVECEFFNEFDTDADDEFFTRSLKKLKTIKVMKSKTVATYGKPSKNGYILVKVQNTSFGTVNLAAGYIVGEAVKILPFLPSDEKQLKRKEPIIAKQKGKRRRSCQTLDDDITTMLCHNAQIVKNYTILPYETRHVVLKTKFQTSIIIFSTALQFLRLLSSKSSSIVVNCRDKHLVCLSKCATEYFFTAKVTNSTARVVELDSENDQFKFELIHKQIFDYGKVVQFGEFDLSNIALFEAINLNNDFFWPSSEKFLQCRLVRQLSQISRDIIVPRNKQEFKKRAVIVTKKQSKLSEMILNNENAGAYGHVLDDKNISICLKNTSSNNKYLKTGELDFLVIMECDVTVERTTEINMIKNELISSQMNVEQI